MKRNPPLPYEPICTAADMGGLLDFPLKAQGTEWTSGPACVSMAAQFYDRRISEKDAAVYMGTNRKQGTLPAALYRRLYHCCHPKIRENMTQKQVLGLINDKRVPVVVLWDDWKGHWAVIIAADRKRVMLADPANRRSCLRVHTWKTFLDH